jgi:glycosyl hydrolase family 26
VPSYRIFPNTERCYVKPRERRSTSRASAPWVGSTHRTTSHARRQWAVFAGCLALATVIMAFIPDPAVAYPPVLVPERGAYVGSLVAPRSGETDQGAIRRVERAIGRQFAVDHRYYRWDEVLPTSDEKASIRAGKFPFINWKAMRADGGVVPWSEIASGYHDDWIEEQARRFKAFDAPAYLTFHHEPEDDAEFGTPGEFASAFRHIVEIFRDERVRKVAFVWTMMSWTFNERSDRDPMDWYPGDRYVDIVGTDAYNWFPLKPGVPWSPFGEIVAPTMRFAEDRGKPVFVVEYGVMEDPDDSDRKANWFRDVAKISKRWPNLKGLIYFDTIKDGWPWNTDSSRKALDGYSDMVNARRLSVMPRLG